MVRGSPGHRLEKRRACGGERAGDGVSVDDGRQDIAVGKRAEYLLDDTLGAGVPDDPIMRDCDA